MPTCRQSRLSSRFDRLFFATVALLLAAAPSLASNIVSCPFSGTGGDQLDRGIVVPNYAGTNIRRLQLGYSSMIEGEYLITAVIHRETFDGPIVGSSSIYLTMPGGSLDDVAGVFHFGGVFDGAPVTAGDTLAITQSYTGPGTLFFDTGTGASCGSAYETDGTTPPLDTLRNDTVGISIDQVDLTSGCIKSDTVFCIDDVPGDRRFQLTVDFNHLGSSGSAQASLGTVGITHGGSFWFFTQDNPEMLVKVLNGCATNNNFWVFASAGTNVGFNLRVVDTSTSVTRTYSNLDGVAALPTQDTAAFPCP
jgi:hypothetical protein